MDTTPDLHLLIERCKKNDRKAQLKLYDDYALAMYRTAYNFLKRQDLARDAMQEGFIKAFKNLDSFDGRSSFGAWLKRIVINVCLDKRKQKTFEIVNLKDVEVIDETDWQVEGNFTAEEIIAKMEELPDKYQNLLKLFLLEGYDHQEIAQILNINEGTSRSILSRGKKKLKALLLKTPKYENRHQGKT